MTCKVSFFKSIRETMKHHIASTFATALVFFIQFLAFFLNVQNISVQKILDVDSQAEYIKSDILYITRPSYIYYFAVALVAIILAYDYFRYLHSKKQMDFYESLPLTRKTAFCQKTASSFFVFLIPYILCVLGEALVLYGYEFRETVFYANLFWNAICMILSFAITWITGVLAMIMTGHPVVACFGFGVFCGYAPVILRYLFPVYADMYFDTYVSNEAILYNLIYISPIGAAIQLIDRYNDIWLFSEHTKSFFILILLAVLVFGLAYYLFIKRPSEAAGRAMAFEKFNPVIRIALVIPLSLYLGIYLGTVTNTANIIWMILGYLLGSVLLHGIIESIFEFDIRALWSRKLQMVLCFMITLGIAVTFWTDAFGYDRYIPQQDKVESIHLNISDSYYYRNSESDGLHDEQMTSAYQLIQTVIENEYTDDVEDSNGVTSMRITYHLKNGNKVYRRYFINTSQYADYLDAIYTTEDYKNDICELYTLDYSKVISVEWYDSVTTYPLILTENQQDTLFETFLSEFTPFSYTEMHESNSLGGFKVFYTSEEGYQDVLYCYIFPQFKQTIVLLEDYLSNTVTASDYGAIDTPLLERYAITSIDIYTYEDEPIYISDPAEIAELKESIYFADEFYNKYKDYDPDRYYDGTAEVLTYTGRSYISIVVPRTALDSYM